MVSLLFGALALYASAKAERELVGEALAENIEGYAERFYADRTELVEPLHRTRGIVVKKTRAESVPEDWRNLDSGLYKIRGLERGKEFTYQLAVRKDAEYWFFVAQDTTKADESMSKVKRAIIASAAILALGSLVVGLWSASRVMRPVSELARRVAEAGGDSPYRRFSDHYGNDEVGQLASALDEYAHRVHSVVQRDLEFNADVSHELRTPLSVIRSAADLLLSRQALNPQTRTVIERIQRAEQSGSDIISALLLLSRSERDESVCDVHLVTEQLVDSHLEHARRKGLDLVLHVESIATIGAHPAAVSVAIGNLISNAIRYTQSGGVRVIVRAGSVSVIDTGPGLSLSDELRVFDRGYRGTQSTRTVGGGIGLSIVQRLCELYEWRVTVENRSGSSGVIAMIELDRSQANASDGVLPERRGGAGDQTDRHPQLDLADEQRQDFHDAAQ